MILYHGTSYDNFRSIVSQEKLSITTDENSHYPKDGHAKTKRGYVYLTDSPIDALEFGTKCWLNTNGAGIQLLVIIKVDVPDNEIEIDPDEERWKSASNEGGKYYRLNRSIDYNKEICEAAFFQFTSYQACCDYIDDNMRESIIWSCNDNKKWQGDAKIMR